MLGILGAKAIGAEVALLVLFLGSASCLWYGYNWGAQRVQAKWDAQQVKDKTRLDIELQEQRNANRSLVEESLTETKDLNAKYAKLSTLYASSLHKKIICPASGEVGDIVLPSELVSSMFIVTTPIAASGRASSGTR